MYSLSELSSSELQSNADVSEADSWFLPLQISGSDGFHWKNQASAQENQHLGHCLLHLLQKHHLHPHRKADSKIQFQRHLNAK